MGKWQELAVSILAAAKVPLTPNEIWTYAKTNGLAPAKAGLTPAASIGAMLYTHIKQLGPAADFVKVGKKPARFALNRSQPLPARGEGGQGQSIAVTVVESPINPVPTGDADKNKAAERDLHPVLASYVSSEPHFAARVRTIFHESSKKAAKGVNEWLHPDMVGVYFPFGKYGKETLLLQKELAVNSVKFFSFELKLKLDFSNLRECFFQAVSNSSWANEGYLVAWKIADDAKLKDELRRLSNAFGIGVIRLDCTNSLNSEILFPATSRSQLDWSTVDRLADENNKMRDLLEHVTGSVKSGHVVGEKEYDEVYSAEKMKQHVQAKHLC